MNSSFRNRLSFSYLKFTKYVTNIIAEPKCKYGQQEQVTVRNHNSSTALERSVLKYWGLKPVLRDPNLALSFCYMTRIMNNRNGNVKHKEAKLRLTYDQNSYHQDPQNKIKTTCIKGQKWPPLKLVYLFIFCSLPHADYKIKT